MHTPLNLALQEGGDAAFQPGLGRGKDVMIGLEALHHPPGLGELRDCDLLALEDVVVVQDDPPAYP